MDDYSWLDSLFGQDYLSAPSFYPEASNYQTDLFTNYGNPIDWYSTFGQPDYSYFDVGEPSFDAGGGTSFLGGIPWGSLLGIGAGAALGGMNGAEQAGVTTSTSAPWGPQQPYLLDLFNRSQAALGTAGQPSADERRMLTQLYGLGDLGAKQVSDTLTGAYMTPDNPMYKSIMDDALNQWNNAYIPGVTSGAYSKDMTGPLSANSAFGQNVYQGERAFGKNMANQLASNLFNPERQRQVAYAGMFNPGTSYGLAQGQRMDPFNVLQQYGRNVTGSYGGTQTQPYYTNQPAGILGGALAGSQIWNNLFKA